MSNAQANDQMLSGSIAREFTRFVVPSVFGMLAVSSASVIDGIFIGNYVGPTALASVTLTMPLLSVVFGILIMISLGGSVAAGKFIGEENPRDASNIFSKTGMVMLVVLVLIALLTIAIPEKIAVAFGAKGTTIEMSALYVWVIAWFFPVFGAAIFFGQFARVDGRPGIAFAGMLGITATNIALDFLLIAYFGWGLFGAALATGLSFVVGALIPASHFIGAKGNLRFMVPFGSWFVILRSCANGFSEFLNEGSAGIVLLLINWVLMVNVGAMGVAAFAIVDYVFYFGILIFYGVSEGIVPLISVNFGGRKPDRIASVLWLAGGFNLLIGVCLIALFLLWPQSLIGFFIQGEEQELRELSGAIIHIIWPLFLFVGANIVISAYFTGMHRPVQSSLIAVIRALIFPVCLITLFSQWFGFMGAFYALPLAEALTFVLSLALLHPRRPTQLMKHQPITPAL